MAEPHGLRRGGKPYRLLRHLMCCKRNTVRKIGRHGIAMLRYVANLPRGKPQPQHETGQKKGGEH